MFNSNKKHKQVGMAKYYFTKLQHKINKDDVLPSPEINSRFDYINEEHRQRHGTGAEQLKAYIDELMWDALQRTNESISWKTIASMVARGVDRVQPASMNMIAKYVMSTLRSKYTSTKLQPTLNNRSKQQCYQWSKRILIFWDSAKLFAPKTQILVVHLDEKWFYCLVVWSHNKWVPFFGIHQTTTINTQRILRKRSCVSPVPDIFQKIWCILPSDRPPFWML